MHVSGVVLTEAGAEIVLSFGTVLSEYDLVFIFLVLFFHEQLKKEN